MTKNYYDITLALAGICQSAMLAQQLAHKGQCDEAMLEPSLQSLLDLNPPSTLAVFGNQPANLRLGLHSLAGMLNAARTGPDGELTRYTLGLMVLERKLHANKNALDALDRRIIELNRQLAHFEILSETIFAAMAAVYVDIISPLGPRIQVTGTPALLQNAQIQAKIRAALLAGIRSAVLWQQVGGGRLQLMFSRNRLFKQAQQILSHV
ncbi:high frequency lysogenization protein HflD [Martelella alba]|uniref:High frequency lysogenization protein HflD n=1 Tax=Martelella alba TaxID=2590451 RepID=A0ABY2SQP8_9HYPH|nr:high frequency lysogenization protein HflD [Martelella alba]TKI07725.1 high frequency lysogenization protein HflD [Martelella alba]